MDYTSFRQSFIYLYYFCNQQAHLNLCSRTNTWGVYCTVPGANCSQAWEEGEKVARWGTS
jgi:hypothetical protein